MSGRTVEAPERHAAQAPAVARIPRATYRLQFQPGFGFADAARVLPYLERLGVSDVYASPLLGSRAGSHHGYDIVDHERLNEDLGSQGAFDELGAALASRGLGLVLDFVPNHMGVDEARANRWWWDVLENGRISPYARFFDVDWDPVKPELKGRVLLPVLGDAYGRVLERGELRLAWDEGALVVRYFEREFPINPRRVPQVLRHGIARLERELGEGHPDVVELLSVLTQLEHLPSIREDDRSRASERQREKEVARGRLQALAARSPRIARHLEQALEAVNGTPGEPESFDRLHALLEGQAYRLAYWRTAFHEINYRRFFDVNALAGLRMEEPEVFEATHRLVLELVDRGVVTGLRLDHVDGLFDPRGYLERLSAATAGARGRPPTPPGAPPAIYTVVEKILSPGERLREDWPVHGTTGYDFLNDVTGLLVDPAAEPLLRRLYLRFTRRTAWFPDVAYAGKRTVMESTLASELNVLAHALNRLSEDDRRTRDFTMASLRDMLEEVVACFPVYRTYVSPAGASEEDARRLAAAVADARRRNPAMPASIFGFFLDVMLDRVDGLTPAQRGARREFALRFQQYTGPVQAKGVEDTAFYRHALLLALNDVGGAPERFARPPEAFLAALAERRARWPHAMLCTTTHDTKRGEDARARLAALSEIPGEWSRAVVRWARLNAAHRTRVADAWAPDRGDEYLYYQTLLGAWPAGEPDLPALAARLREHMIKAVREAKLHTSWITEDREYDEAMSRFVEATLTGRRARRFLESFAPFAARLARLGMVNSLAQAALKLTAPGVPDLYQGSEGWDLSLVDPDNRAPVDFAARERALDSIEPALSGAFAPDAVRALLGELLANWQDARIKTLVVGAALRTRARHEALFRDGDLVPLAAGGDRAAHVVAFARTLGDEAAVTAVPRLAARLDPEGPPLGPGAWGGDTLQLPPALGGRAWRDALTGARLEPASPDGDPRLELARLFAAAPVALLEAVPRGG